MSRLLPSLLLAALVACGEADSDTSDPRPEGDDDPGTWGIGFDTGDADLGHDGGEDDGGDDDPDTDGGQADTGQHPDDELPDVEQVDYLGSYVGTVEIHLSEGLLGYQDTCLGELVVEVDDARRDNLVGEGWCDWDGFFGAWDSPSFALSADLDRATGEISDAAFTFVTLGAELRTAAELEVDDTATWMSGSFAGEDAVSFLGLSTTATWDGSFTVER